MLSRATTPQNGRGQPEESWTLLTREDVFTAVPCGSKCCGPAAGPECQESGG